MSKNLPRFYVIHDPTVLRIIPALATEIGFNESIVIMQLEYLVSISNTEIKDGKHWTYQSVRDLKENFFPFWSIATINRTIKSLEEKELIFTGNYNKKRYDKTRWFSINYDRCNELDSISVNYPSEHTLLQNETHSNQNGTHSNQNETTIPETTTETTTNIKELQPSAGISLIEWQEQQKKLQEEKKKNVPQTPHGLMVEALRQVTEMDMKLDTNAGRIVRASKQLREAGYTYKDVEEFGRKWKQDWRYQKNKKPPVLTTIIAEIKQVEREDSVEERKRIAFEQIEKARQTRLENGG